MSSLLIFIGGVIFTILFLIVSMAIIELIKED